MLQLEKSVKRQPLSKSLSNFSRNKSTLLPTTHSRYTSNNKKIHINTIKNKSKTRPFQLNKYDIHSNNLSYQQIFKELDLVNSINNQYAQLIELMSSSLIANFTINQGTQKQQNLKLKIIEFVKLNSKLKDQLEKLYQTKKQLKMFKDYFIKNDKSNHSISLKQKIQIFYNHYKSTQKQLLHLKSKFQSYQTLQKIILDKQLTTQTHLKQLQGITNSRYQQLKKVIKLFQKQKQKNSILQESNLKKIKQLQSLQKELKKAQLLRETLKQKQFNIKKQTAYQQHRLRKNSKSKSQIKSNNIKT